MADIFLTANTQTIVNASNNNFYLMTNSVVFNMPIFTNGGAFSSNSLYVGANATSSGGGNSCFNINGFAFTLRNLSGCTIKGDVGISINGDSSTIVNSGGIVGTSGLGISAGGQDFYLKNLGYVLGGVSVTAGTIENLGEIDSIVSNGSAAILNNGHITGNITFTGNFTNNYNGVGGKFDGILQDNGGSDNYTLDSYIRIVDTAGADDQITSTISFDLSNAEYFNDTLQNRNQIERLSLDNGNINGTGNDLANIITGGTGANILDGGQGLDTLQGGAGDDTYLISTELDIIKENANGGIDTVLTKLSIDLTDATYTGQFIEKVTLQGADNLNAKGNGLDNTLTGNSGNNELNGLAGADQMSGESGDDIYYVDSLNDVVIEDIDKGWDTVKATTNCTLGDNVERLELSGVAFQGTGNALNNVILGSANNDTLAGLAGNDTIDGGAGADVLIGGAGDDTYFLDNVGDQVLENANEGKDTIYTSFDYTLAADSNVEQLALFQANAKGTGNNFNNYLAADIGQSILIGLGGNDILDGGTGADQLDGGSGNDTYYIDNSGDKIIDASGTDTVITTLSYTLASNLERLILSGAANISGAGNKASNTIIGNGGNNVLKGLEGNDILSGGLGTDSLYGGLGNDTYTITESKDKIIEASNQGTDTVKASISYTLGANLEKLILAGALNLTGNGNSLANALTGNSGANTLTGFAGNDNIRGGLGNDNLDGGANHDRLYGDGGNDLLFGSLGNDTVNGGIGSDRLAGGADNDTFVFAKGYGKDEIMDFGFGKDRLDIRAFNDVTSFTDLMKSHVKQVGDDLWIYSGSDTLIINDATKSDLSTTNVLI